MSGKRSLIWKYFNAGKLDVKARCNVCKSQISRGGQNPKQFTTTSLVNHLRVHKDAFAKYTAELAQSARETKPDPPQVPQGASAGQQTMQQCLEKAKVWDINSDKAKTVH